MDVDKIKQEAVDSEHLRLLALFHYISGGLTILFSFFFMAHLAFMSFMLRNFDKFEPAQAPHPDVDPEQFLGIFIFVFGTMIAFGIIFGIAQIISGRFLKQRRHRMFSFIVALPNVIFIPYGTLLAIMTLMVIDRPSVKQMYAAQE